MGKRLPWWKWLLLLIAGFFAFTIVLAVAEIPLALDENLSLSVWVFMLLCLVASAAVLGAYTLWRRIDGYRKAPDLPMRKGKPDLWKGFGIGAVFFALVTGSIALMEKIERFEEVFRMCTGDELDENCSISELATAITWKFKLEAEGGSVSRMQVLQAYELCYEFINLLADEEYDTEHTSLMERSTVWTEHQT